MQSSQASRSRQTTRPMAEFWAGARDIVPLVIGAIPFGLIFGTLALSSGVSVWGAIALSSIVFAGSAQFIAIGMVATGTAWPLIVLTTFVVNLRHLLYSMSLLPHVETLAQRWKIPMAFLLTDETFAVAIRRYEAANGSPHAHWYYFGAAIVMYVNWQMCTWLGIAIGQRIPDATAWGLDFAMSATFIGMVIPYLKNRPMRVAVVVAGLAALLANPLPHKLGLIVAVLCGIAAGIWSETCCKTG